MSSPDRRPRRIVVLAGLDRFANGVKPREIQRVLHARGHVVELIDTYHLSRAGTRRARITSRLPGPGPRRAALFALETLAGLANRWAWCRVHLSHALLVGDIRVRADILARRLRGRTDVDLIISETPHDAWALPRCRGTALTHYDCPTPWADELYDEGRLTRRQHRALRARESQLFESVDVLSFHWRTYAEYARAHYGIRGHNLMTLDFGCHPATMRAGYRSPVRIVYLGSLSSRFIDLELLSRLSRLYPNIDVYGGPEPNRQLGLRYRGPASPDVLLEYQFGLITCTDDELRREGFSAKHLEYFAHGLPVLVPEWRRHLELLDGSITYREDTFLAVIAHYSDPRRWQDASTRARRQAERLRWERTLTPLVDLVENLP